MHLTGRVNKMKIRVLIMIMIYRVLEWSSPALSRAL